MPDVHLRIKLIDALVWDYDPPIGSEGDSSDPQVIYVVLDCSLMKPNYSYP